ncbi:MAG: type IV pilus twitching motility protein PilT [Deltaproteobacteria bacterium]|nr:type IV pilus twitching motility protein PilT [Deltaproteobacteria bacterium]
MDAQGFVNLLAAAVKHKVSDIHLHPGSPPAFRVKGDLVAVKAAALTEADMHVVLSVIISDPVWKAKIAEIKDYDGSFEVQGLSRFRFNVFRHCGKLGAIMRLIPAQVPSLDGMGLPPVLKKISDNQRGLVLVTGATGSGKSSTLAAMIDHINTNYGSHILTIEDPLEFIHTAKKARLTQRAIGPDTVSFAGALRSALRQDPDIILVGEMRDPETIDIALKAAETGHMVFSTVHTQDAMKTIGRLIAVFPPEEQRMVRQRLADNLQAIVSQRLVKRADGKGLIAAQEIMVSNMSIAECIADPAKTGEMNDYIQKSREMTGGQTFDQHLAELYQSGTIALETAMEAASNPSDFQRNLSFGAGGVSGAAKAPANGNANGSGGNGATPPDANKAAFAEHTVVLDFAKEKEKDKAA